MNRRIFVPILLVLALFSIIYAVYRSTDQRITTIANGREVVTGEPQHGLILGMCLFAGACILAVARLWEDNPVHRVTHAERTSLANRTVS